jgi:hypothetical protein
MSYATTNKLVPLEVVESSVVLCRSKYSESLSVSRNIFGIIVNLSRPAGWSMRFTGFMDVAMVY